MVAHMVPTITSSADVKTLLDLIEDVLPLGQKGWQVIYLKFTQWAIHHNHPHHKAQSLETELTQFMKTTKPTGDGQAQDKDCATRTLVNMQLLTQGQQLHDANAITEKLYPVHVAQDAHTILWLFIPIGNGPKYTQTLRVVQKNTDFNKITL
ncbi:hypothetical protein EDB19DRAFT_1825233 [Suillus lakei]|nr:hypothetical protein EDB19DRAFT_1825233 [Suillus lakei]